MNLIENVILENYVSIHRKIIDTTLGDSVYHAFLTGVAMGDGRIHSAYKRARISEDIGKPTVRYLCQSGMIEREASRAMRVEEGEEHRVSDRLHFTMPFMRFWFAFVSPLFKGIAEGDYTEVQERFENRKHEFSDLIFLQLSMELLKKNFQSDPIVEIGSYWEKDVEIDILSKTASGKVVVATCKYGNAKMKKSELSKLHESCEKAGFEPDVFVLFSKRGFTNELKGLKGETLKLYSVKNFKSLLEGLDDKDVIESFI
jgi:hypothetical protein